MLSVHRSCSSSGRCCKMRGFSLLEVIIATGILATSTVLLLSLFSTGERHTKRAERRVLAQMLCQSKLDELIVDSAQLQAVENEPLEGYPDWSLTVEWAPLEIAGLVSVRVLIQQTPERNKMDAPDTTPPSATFSLVRWMRHPAVDAGIPHRTDVSDKPYTDGLASSNSP